MSQETLQTDILIIGSGGAASRAAYEAKRLEPGLDVTVATEAKWGRGGSTVWVASETLGINAPLNAAGDGDSPEVYLRDIVATGLGLANESLASIIAHEASERIQELIEMGVTFDRAGDKVCQRKLSGCTKARSLAQGGQTGVSIVSVLKKAALKQGVNVLEGVRFLDLIHEEGEVWGARGFKGDVQIDVLAKAVILANGGAGAIFPHNVNHPSLRGDGFAMAYRAGADLSNLEFFQIGPGVVYPKMHFIIHSHMWNFCPRLRNAQGKEFLADYLPDGVSRDEVLALKSMSYPFSVRTNARYLDISIFKEVTSGRGTQHGGVFFDVNHIPERQLREKAPITYETFLNKGVNLCTDQIEIAPLVQNFSGGVKIDENAATTLPGLFAVGEVSGGVHGADRPGGNNLTDCQVFGYRGGRAAARLAAQRKLKTKEGLKKKEMIPPEKTAGTRAVSEGMDKALMIVRHKEGLSSLLKKIEACGREVSSLDITTGNFLLLAEMFTRSALHRKESRGVHYREDFPKTDPAFERPSLVRKGNDGEMICSLA